MAEIDSTHFRNVGKDIRNWSHLSDPALGGDRGVAICHETVPDSIGDSPISPDTPTRPILGTEEVIEVARGE